MNILTKIILFFGVIVLIAGGYLLLTSSSPIEGEELASLSGMEVTIYKSPYCGCCDNYIGYLRRSGFMVEEIEMENIETKKEELAIPDEMSSCHTAIWGDYVVEGHMPLEVIAKLISESPAIKGIALPGMPSGSPGMPGGKTEVFNIHSFSDDGITGMFMEI